MHHMIDWTLTHKHLAIIWPKTHCALCQVLIKVKYDCSFSNNNPTDPKTTDQMGLYVSLQFDHRHPVRVWRTLCRPQQETPHYYPFSIFAHPLVSLTPTTQSQHTPLTIAHNFKPGTHRVWPFQMRLPLDPHRHIILFWHPLFLRLVSILSPFWSSARKWDENMDSWKWTNNWALKGLMVYLAMKEQRVKCIHLHLLQHIFVLVGGWDLKHSLLLQPPQ